MARRGIKRMPRMLMNLCLIVSNDEFGRYVVNLWIVVSIRLP